MASNPHLRHNPERLRLSASWATHGPVRSQLPAFLGSITSFPRPLTTSQLARLGRERAPLEARAA